MELRDEYVGPEQTLDALTEASVNVLEAAIKMMDEFDMSADEILDWLGEELRSYGVGKQ